MKTINIAILAHVDAGKTSLTEALLNVANDKYELGSVDQGTTVSDSDALEKERGISIYTSTTSLNYKNTKINIIDTPGHMDFIHEVEQALMVTDVAILLVNATDEMIKSQTLTVYKKLEAMNIPTIIFFNKIDLLEEELDGIMNKVITMTNDKAVDLNSTIKLNEHLASNDEMYLMKYLENDITESDTQDILHKTTLSLDTIPILKGSALKGWALPELLDLITLLSDSNDSKDILSALIYKKDYDSKGVMQTYIRLYSGSLNFQDTIIVNNKEYKVFNLYGISEGEVIEVSKIFVNDIAIIKGPFPFKVGEWINEKQINKIIPKWTKGNYVSSLTYEEGTRVKVLEALNKIIDVNPFVEYEIDEMTQDINIILVGEVQKEVIVDTLSTRYGLDVSLGDVKVMNKITPKEEIEDIVIMNTVENSHWATMKFKMEPLDTGAGYIYKTLVNTGYLRQAFQNAIEESLDHLLNTPYKGQLITDFQLTLTEAEFASPVSTPSDFRHSTKVLFNKIMNQCSFDTLEPVGTFTLRVFESSLKRAYKDLNNVNAKITDTFYNDDYIEISGEMLMKHSINYEHDVLAYTNGYGSFKIRLTHYKKC